MLDQISAEETKKKETKIVVCLPLTYGTLTTVQYDRRKYHIDDDDDDLDI